jgi:hypothetical protein
MKLQVPNHDLTNLTSDHISGIWCDLKPMINHIKHVNINHVNRFLAISMAKKIFSQYPNISEHFLTTNQKTYGGFLSPQGTPSHHPFFLGISHETIQLFLGSPMTMESTISTNPATLRDSRSGSRNSPPVVRPGRTIRWAVPSCSVAASA